MENRVVEPDGTQKWYDEYGQLHRLDGPAFIDHFNQIWYKSGAYHREDGPAVEHADGFKAWWVNGLRHRLDGPAVESPNGHKGWWINGIFFTEAEYYAHLEANHEKYGLVP